MRGALQWAGVAVGTAVLTALGVLWLLGRRAVVRFRRERREKNFLPEGTMVSHPVPRISSQENREPHKRD
ncbi:MAG: hypothetical protein WHT07_07820 [Desulfobaccales bacterium]